MLNANLLEVLCVVDFFIKADQGINTKLFEEVNVSCWGVSLDIVAISGCISRRRAGHNFARNNPIQVTVFYPFEVFIPKIQTL